MATADRNSWIMTGSIMKNMKKSTKDAPLGCLKAVGLKNCHSYTVIDVREVILDTGELEYLLFLRNPTGNFYNKDGEIWSGDWGPKSSKWTNKVRKQLDYFVTEKDMEKAKQEGIKDLLGTAQNFMGKGSKKGWKKGPKGKWRKLKKGDNNRKDTEDGNETFLHDGSLERLDPDMSDE
jgi:hypothetical protein